MSMLNHIAIVSVPVADQGRARSFYEDVLGFEVRMDNPFMEDARWIELAPPGGQTSITLVTWFDWMPPGSIHGLVLDTDDVEAVAARLTAKQWEATPIETAPWGRYLTLNDPDGNGWVIQQSAGS